MNTVLDASAALAWLVVRDSPSEALLADHLLDEIEYFNVAVPLHWRVEVCNGMLRALRTQRVTRADAISFSSRIETLPILPARHQTSGQWARIHQLALTHALTAYDAAYVELAARSGSCLATFDRKLADAARAAGVSVFGQSHGVAEPLPHYG